MVMVLAVKHRTRVRRKRSKGTHVQEHVEIEHVHDKRNSRRSRDVSGKRVLLLIESNGLSPHWVLAPSLQLTQAKPLWAALDGSIAGWFGPVELDDRRRTPKHGKALHDSMVPSHFLRKPLVWGGYPKASLPLLRFALERCVLHASCMRLACVLHASSIDLGPCNNVAN
jgi:hypothetical protein